MLYIIILQMPAQPLYWAQIQKANWRIHNMKKKWKLYVWISYINLFISTFTFGGGYVIIPMVKKIFVTQKKLLQEVSRPFIESRRMSAEKACQVDENDGALNVELELEPNGVVYFELRPVSVKSDRGYCYEKVMGE